MGAPGLRRVGGGGGEPRLRWEAPRAAARVMAAPWAGAKGGCDWRRRQGGGARGGGASGGASGGGARGAVPGVAAPVQGAVRE